MDHVVFFPASEGAPGFRLFSALDEAVSFVEHLRNEEGVADVRLYALTEVPLSFKTIYRVEVPSGSSVPEPPAASDVEPVAEAAPVAEAVEDSTEAVVEAVAVQIPAPTSPTDFTIGQPEQEIAMVAVSENGERGLGYFAGQS